MLKIGVDEHELFKFYCLARSPSDAKSEVWKHVCELLRSEVTAHGMTPLLPFLDIFHTNVLPSADFANAGFDGLIIDHALKSLSSDASLKPALEILLHTPEPIASSDMPRVYLTRLVDFLEEQLSTIAGDASFTIPEQEISTALSLLSIASAVQLYSTVGHYPAFVVVFQWAELVPCTTSLQPEIEQKARAIYEKLVTGRGPWSLPDLYAMTASRFGELLLEKHCHIRYVKAFRPLLLC